MLDGLCSEINQNLEKINNHVNLFGIELQVGAKDDCIGKCENL